MVFHMTIAGKPYPVRDRFDVLNPATGEAAGHAPSAALADLDAAVAAARAAFPAWAATSDEDRAEACRRIAAVLRDNADDLAHILTQEQGKPLGGMGSRFELGGAAAWAEHTAGLSLPMRVLQDDNTGRTELYHKPLGVVGSITPWNWPLMIAIWHVVPAIRAGNTVVIKPSPYTPLSTLRMIERIAAVLPPGVVNSVTGPDAIGAAMSAHAGIDKIVFTGSTATGRKVFASAAETMKRLTLELGGNDAGIVLPDCDPKAIAPGLFWGAFINNGQTCSCLKRLYVHDSIHDAVCDELAKFAATVRVGDGLDEANELGPIQNRMQYDKVLGFVADARARGGKVLCGGVAPDGPGLFYPPTLIAGLDAEAPLVSQEQFGPVLPILRYSDVEEALRAANDNPNGLGGSVWSRDADQARTLVRRLDCGTGWINMHGVLRPNAPMGGVKQSGIGIEFAEEGLQEFTSIQVVIS